MSFKTTLVVGACASIGFAGGPTPCVPVLESEIMRLTAVNTSSTESIALISDVAGNIEVYDISGGLFHLVNTLARGAVTEDILFTGHHAVILYEDSNVEIIDFSEPLSPVVVSEFAPDFLPNQILIDSGRLFMIGEDSGLVVYSLADLANPTLLMDDPDLFGNSIGVSGSLIAYSINTNPQRGTYIYDITDMDNPLFVQFISDAGFSIIVGGQIEIHNSCGSSTYEIATGNWMGAAWNCGKDSWQSAGNHQMIEGVHWFTRGVAGDQDPGLSRIHGLGGSAYYSPEISNPTDIGPSAGSIATVLNRGDQLLEMGTGRLDGQIRLQFTDVLVDGGLLHLAAGSLIETYDITNLSEPVKLGSHEFETGGTKYEVLDTKLGDGFAVMLQRSDYWIYSSRFVTVMDLETMTPIGGAILAVDQDWPLSAFPTAIDGNRVLVGDPNGGDLYEIVDHQAIEIGDSDLFDSAEHLALRGNFAASTDDAATLSVFDLVDPQNIALIGTLSGVSGEIYFVSQTTIASIEGNTVSFVDLSDPSLPSIVSVMIFGDEITATGFSNRLLGIGYKGIDSSTMVMIDASDATNPTVVESVTQSGSIHAIGFSEQVRVSSGHDGFRLYQSCGSASCQADFTGDGVIDFFDVGVFLQAFSGGDLLADFTGDGLLNFFDISEFLIEFAAGCP